MLEQPFFLINDPVRVRAIIAEFPWVTLVTHNQTHGLVVSHLPILPETEEAGEVGPVGIVGHLARRDGEFHELGRHDVVVIVEGPNGYLSPTWYGEVPHVPTWDFVVVHLHGRPEILQDEATYDVLSDTVDRFESRLPQPWRLEQVDEYGRRIAPGTVGFRLRPTRVVAKAKLSQDESPAMRKNTIEQLRAPGPYQNHDLADLMAQTLEQA